MPRLSKIGAACLAAFGWTGLSSVTASYLVVAGGGSGGGIANEGGSAGGGAGGYLTGTTALNPTLSYTVTVGAGGAVTTNRTVRASNGSNSVFNAITSIGGGSGGNRYDIGGVNNGAVGGSGGAGAPGQSSSAGNGSGAAGTSGQGNAGGNPLYNDGADRKGGGGGGGAGAVGANGNNGTYAPGNGGAGLASSISGSSVTYAGGGGGGGDDNGLFGTGGAGGGANGGSNNSAATAATANLGGGGGGSGNNTPGTPSNGGSGVVIISYPSPQQFGGGIVTVSGANTIHTFTTSGTLSPLSTLTANFLVVAGGGGGSIGNGGGGGGAGGLLSGSSLIIDTNSIYTVTVGSGGAGGSTYPATGSNGGNSIFSGFATTSVGGGGGGAGVNGANGGSGGGTGFSGASGGTGTVGQGNNGGLGDLSPFTIGGGGGGAGAVGGNASPSVSGTGGNGSASSISGSSVTYAGGGSGGSDGRSGATIGVAGTGGGGTGSVSGAGSAGSANLGGGGGGGGRNGALSPAEQNGGAGGSGVVIISYSGATQLMAGGTVTISGGNVIHTFNSSGYLTPLTLIGNSLRFRSSASAYLNRTPPTAGNRKTWTWSAWAKLGTIAASNGTLFNAGTTSGETTRFYLRYTGSQFQTGYGSQNLDTTVAVYRDPAAWYHIVLAVDTTQATASNRIKIYVNGVQQAVTTSVNFTQNVDTAVNNAVSHQIASDQIIPGGYYDGYMTEVQLIDGQALTPNSFGTANQFGVWQPIRYGGSYGTNGFYLPFSNTAVSANFLVVGGGGGGGGTGNGSGGGFAGGGGGGAGGLRSTVTATGGGGSLESALTINQNSSYTVTVGAGGTGGLYLNSTSTNGGNSVFSSITSTGGGGLVNGVGQVGGSGGGAYGRTGSGAGTANQGFKGGDDGITGDGGTGGGGAGVKGGTVNSDTGSVGGDGVATSITGSSVTYAGGGGGGGYGASNSNGGLGGSGGGGRGAIKGSDPVAGTTNTGGGGGGATQNTVSTNLTGANGGSGIVIVSYSGNQKFIGGTVTSSGGNTIHTFTSSGTLVGNIATDYSPQGNNWTPNNISLTSGSTYDSMTDVPTLTSTTAANYCTWNPLANTSFNTLSNGNLTVTGNTSSNNGNTASTFAFTNGFWYVEMVAGGTATTTYPSYGITLTTNTQTLSNGGTGNNQVGFASSSVIYRTNGEKVVSSSVSSYGASWTTGDIIGIAVDATNGAVYYSKNGIFQGGGVPTSGASKTGAAYTWTGNTDLYSFATSQYNGSSASFNFGQQPFTYTAPSGFLPLNTFNL